MLTEACVHEPPRLGRQFLTAAQLVAEKAGPPAAVPTAVPDVPAFAPGYDWVSEQLKAAGFVALAAEVSSGGDCSRRG
jgi:hypothetical protein